MPATSRLMPRPGKRPVTVMTLDPPERREVGCVTLRLPMPPSVNAITRYGRHGVYTSLRSDGWRTTAGKELLIQKPGRVVGPYALHLRLCRSETKMDLDNGAKEVSDLLQEHRVIANDRDAERVTLEWGADTGVIVTVLSARSDLDDTKEAKR